MGIKLECQRNFGVPQDFRKRPHIHARLHSTGREGVPQRMNPHGVKPCLLEGAMENAVQIASFIGRANVCAKNKVIRNPGITCGETKDELLPPLSQQDLLHPGRKRNGAASRFGFRRARFQRGAGSGVI